MSATAKSVAKPLLLTNIGQLLTLKDITGRNEPRRGRELLELGIIENAAIFCREGKIAAVGSEVEIGARATQEIGSDLRVFDCRGGTVLPGFVDSHTHPVFVSPRLVDFEQRIQGSTYEQIANAGGGIRSSIERVRKASEDDLVSAVLRAFEDM